MREPISTLSSATRYRPLADLSKFTPMARPARAAPVDVSDSTTSEHSGMLFGLGRTRRVSQHHVQFVVEQGVKRLPVG